MAQRLEDDGEARLAQRIRRLTKGASRPAGSTFAVQGLPADVEAHQFLVEQISPKGIPQYPVLTSPTNLELRRFVELNRRSAELASAGIEPPSTLLLFGPSGCGKTMAAFAIANDLGLPLLVVRLDSLLGSFLGNSAKNLRRVFDNALARPCVLLLDEFDAIGKMRDDIHEVGEVKRLVGSLLQNLDQVRGEQIVIAATNHHHMLDAAIWRRFDVTLKLWKPGKSELSKIILNIISEDRLSSIDLNATAALSDSLSGSDITNVITRALQDEFLYPDDSLQKRITLNVLARLKGYESSTYHADNKKALIRAIHNQVRERLTIRQVARLVRSSSAYAHEVIRSTEKASQC